MGKTGEGDHVHGGHVVSGTSHDSWQNRGPRRMLRNEQTMIRLSCHTSGRATDTEQELSSTRFREWGFG